MRDVLPREYLLEYRTIDMHLIHASSDARKLEYRAKSIPFTRHTIKDNYLCISELLINNIS